jgi:glycosyltransferase involved in cell wall biosynthesis
LTIPHGQIYNGRKLRTFQEKPRIAFVGHPVINKGWLRFLNFVDLAMKDFDFYHFGAVNSNEPGVRYFPLVNQFGNLNMARDLLVEHQIDAVFICPTWEETFCFVAYESLAAGCEIICNTKSGNVVDASVGHSIFLEVEDVHSVARVKSEVIEARKLDRFVSDFVFTGTIASEYAK